MTGTFPLCKSILIAGKKVISLKDKAVKTTDLSWLVHLFISGERYRNV